MLDDLELEDEWLTIHIMLGLEDGKYQIIKHARYLFSDTGDGVKIARHLQGLTETDRWRGNKKADFSATFFSSKYAAQYVIVRTIALQDVGELDFLVDENIRKDIRFYVLLQILQLFHGCYVFDKVATNSDFWSAMHNSRIDDLYYLSFHVFSWIRQSRGGLTNDSDIQGSRTIFNAKELARCIRERAIIKSRSFLNIFMAKILSILQLPIFNQDFKDFYDRYDPYIRATIAYDKDGSEYDGLLRYFHDATVFDHWCGDESLIVQKISSLLAPQDKI